MSWLDELLDQVGQNGSDAVPSDPQTDTTFNPGKDSQAASSLFGDLFKPETTDASTAAGPYLGAAKDSQAANAALGLEPDYRIPSVAGFVSEQKDPGIIAGILKNLAIKKTSDGSIDYSDPKTIDTLMKLVMSGGSLVSAMMNRGQPQNYQSPAQLQASLKSPENNWTPQQQATANAFFNTPMQGGLNRSRIYAADMTSPIVAGKGYADGGVIPPAPTSGSSTWNGQQWAPLQGTPSPGYNPNYTAPSSAAVNGYLSGTGGQGISASRGLSSLEGASIANTGHALSPQDFANYGGQIEGGMDPSQLASSMGWTKPADVAWAPPAPSAFPSALAQGQRGPLARPVGMGQPRNNGMQMRGGPPPGVGDAAQGRLPTPHVLPPQDAPIPGATAFQPQGLGAVPAMTTPIVPFSSQSASFSAYPGYQPPRAMRGGGRIGGGFAHGGALGHVMANTGGQDDVVPIRAAGGEYMMDADTVSALGDGNNAAGAKKLDAMRENIRAHKRSAPPNKIPPKAKPIGQYMKGGK